MGKFKRGFAYRTLVPFQSGEAPLSSEDTRRNIVMIRYSQEIGTPMVKEPRWAGMFSSEDLSP
jgi:hypothetical protein